MRGEVNPLTRRGVRFDSLSLIRVGHWTTQVSARNAEKSGWTTTVGFGHRAKTNGAEAREGVAKRRLQVTGQRGLEG